MCEVRNEDAKQPGLRKTACAFMEGSLSIGNIERYEPRKSARLFPADNRDGDERRVAVVTVIDMLFPHTAIY